MTLTTAVSKVHATAAQRTAQYRSELAEIRARARHVVGPERRQLELEIGWKQEQLRTWRSGRTLLSLAQLAARS